MAKKESTVFVCENCGHQEPKWMGKCPECGSWNSFNEEVLIATDSNSNVLIDDKVRKLSSVQYEKNMRTQTGILELDRVLGGGVMRPSSVLVGGEPGIGKSTIMLQMISALSEKGKALYISGEESPSQVKLRAERLGLEGNKINIYCDVRLEHIIKTLEDIKPEYVIIDSLQTIYSSNIPSPPSSLNQIKATAMELIVFCKRNNVALFFIGHVTKDGALAGPKIIEHMVDTVLYFETIETGMRLLRSSKNRFGSVDEIGIFLMSVKGLVGVKDPSSFFLVSREKGEIPAGIVFTPIVEGTRTFVVEIQALVVPAKSGYQRVYSDRIDSSRVQRIAAILERHASLDLSDYDIYLNVAGGMKLKEGSIDLPIALALYSSKINKPLPLETASFGELSLAGEVRPVQFAEKRKKTLKEMGFSNIICREYEKEEIESLNVKDIKAAILMAFKKVK